MDITRYFAPRDNGSMNMFRVAVQPAAGTINIANGGTLSAGSIVDILTLNMNADAGSATVNLNSTTAQAGTIIQANANGFGSATVKGIFDAETFSVSPGGTTTFAPTHQFHLGVWFNNPNVPFNRGCEPGAPSPIVTPFNGEQHAGIQVVNTSNFPDAAGPLSHVTR